MAEDLKENLIREEKTVLVNTKIYTGRFSNEKKLDRGLNSGLYRIYQKREKNFNYFQIEFREKLQIYISNNGNDITEYLTNVKRAEILEYLDKTCIRLYDKEDARLTDYEFETTLNQIEAMNFLEIDYHTILGRPFFAFHILAEKMKKERFLDKTFVNAPVSHLLITDDFEKMYEQKKISLSISSNDDYTETRIYNLQEVNFKVLRKTIKNVDNMRIKEKRAEIVVTFYDKKAELIKEVKSTDIFKHFGRLLCLKAGILNNTIQLTESKFYILGNFLDQTSELSKRLLPLE